MSSRELNWQEDNNKKKGDVLLFGFSVFTEGP
jgi:hypothetical protein